jgi:cellulose synthase/poly-beta-1,6-N-acetylglucosamine synthase-like glycosyltransferase
LEIVNLWQYVDKGVLAPFFYFISTVYGLVFTLLALFFWTKRTKSQSISSKKSITVICTAKNESSNIVHLINDLANQSHDNFDLYFFDNESTDGTFEIVDAHPILSFPIVCKKISSIQNRSPKKEAISLAVTLSQADIFVCVDADCRVGSKWLESIDRYGDFDFLASPVCIAEPQNFLSAFQGLEFCVLMLVTGSTFNLRVPIMANGANMAFSRRAFVEVGGYTGNQYVVTGDDEFLLTKVKKRFPDTVFFNFDQEAIVKTYPHLNLKALVNQKVRWASKWKHNMSWVKIGLAALVFASNLSLIYAFFFAEYWLIYSKYVIDILILTVSVVYFKQTKLFKYVPLAILVYPFYALMVAILSIIGKYEWKGKDYQT